jgi:hypothetical protein
LQTPGALLLSIGFQYVAYAQAMQQWGHFKKKNKKKVYCLWQGTSREKKNGFLKKYSGATK